MTLTVITPPAFEPLTLAEVKDHLRDPTSEDPLIEGWIPMAREYVENDTWRALVTQTLDYTLDWFPGILLLPRAPVQSVTSITYTDDQGTPQILAASEYQTDVLSEPARIMPGFNKSWPTTQAVFNAVQVRFVAGHGNPPTIPHGVRLAMKLLISHYHQNRGDQASEIAAARIDGNLLRSLDTLLSPHRVRH